MPTKLDPSFFEVLDGLIIERQDAKMSLELDPGEVFRQVLEDIGNQDSDCRDPTAAAKCLVPGICVFPRRQDELFLSQLAVLNGFLILYYAEDWCHNG